MNKLFIHSQCHIGSPTWLMVDGNNLVLICAQCESVIFDDISKINAAMLQEHGCDKCNNGVCFCHGER